MASARRISREIAVTLLYAQDVGNENALKNSDQLFEDRKIKGKYRDFALELFQNSSKELAKIDELVSAKLSENWSFDRLGRLERAILRLAVYELISTETDKPIVINEAIEIAKKLADDQAPRLINGVLEAIRKDIS